MLVRYAFAVVVGVLGACSFTGPEPSDAPGNPVTVSFEATDPTTNADERSGVVLLRIALSEALTTDVVVTFGLAGTAMPATDFTVSTNTVTIPAGSTTQDIPFTITDDGIEMEDPETIDVTLLSADNGVTVGDRAMHTVTIADRILPRVRFAMVSTMHVEGGTQMALQLNLTLAAQGTTTVDVAVLPSSTATPLADAAIAAITTVTFADGATTAMVPIGEINDALDEEDDELFNFALQNPSDNLIVEGSGITATHIITDDDASPSVGFAVTNNPQPEAAGVVTVDVQLSAVSGRNVTVNYAFGSSSAAVPGDAAVNPAPGTLTILAGTMGASIQVTVNDDTLDEPNETLTLDLSAPGNATLGIASQAFIIQDNDATPTVAFETTGVSVTEADIVVNANVVLSAASGRPITVQFTVADSADNPNDYTIVTSPLSIPAGTATMPIAITLKNDTTDEPDETVVLTLTNPSNADLGAQVGFTLTINDDDAASTVQFDPTEQDGFEFEGESGTTQFVYELVLDKPSGFDITVPVLFGGDATIPGDYTANPPPSGTAPTLSADVVFPAGTTSRTITLTIVGDQLNDDGNADTVEMTIDSGNVTNATVGAGVERNHVIRDDD